ncbi:GDSL-type esterase/lipase family protein [Phocaeicola vulgatus]|nr:GDSL-type esterase/lipase family protein [Phocaeicola vulgatus]
MKRIFLACICYLLILPTGLWAKRIIKVACVGNSITYGAGISNREKNSYPAQLQYYLGDDYEVRNFGSNGATAQSDGDYPYVRTGVYGESKNFLPDIVLIKLGTNDTKPQNWKDEKHFMEEYQTLIDTYRSLDSHPQVILLTPVRCFLTEKNTISPRIIEEKVRLVVEQLAYDNGLGI